MTPPQILKPENLRSRNLQRFCVSVFLLLGLFSFSLAQGPQSAETTGPRSNNLVVSKAGTLTLAAAKAAAKSGTTIYVRPGSYTITASLAKNGVNWHFDAGAAVARSDNTTEAIFDDGNTAMTFSVTGDADFTRTTTNVNAYVARVRHASSNILLHCRDVRSDAGSAEATPILHEGGRFDVIGRNCYAGPNTGGGGTAYGLYWTGGSGSFHFLTIDSVQYSMVSRVTGTDALDWYVECDEATGLIGMDGSNPNAALWVRGKTLGIHPDNVELSVWCVSASNGSKGYLTFQKYYGQINALDLTGLLYIRGDKHSQIFHGDDPSDPFGAGLLYVSGATGRVFYDVLHADPGIRLPSPLTATITIASPGVVTTAAHNFAAGDAVRFATTGALPTGLTAATVYYVSVTSLTSTTFRLASTKANALAGTNINTSGSQSGVHTLSSVGFGGAAFRIAATSGVVDFIHCDFTGTADSLGVQHEGGTLRLAPGVRLDTSANSSTSPITKSGGTLVVGAGAVLKTHSSSTSISAPTAQDVINYGYMTNFAKDADVTLKVLTSETVSTDVQ